MLVVDASVLAPALADDGTSGDLARERLRGQQLIAPEMIDIEVTAVLRKQLRAGDLDNRRAELALSDLVDLPLRRVPHRGLLARCWQLRENLTMYDASYVATAELFDIPVLTADARLARAPGPRCQIELLTERPGP